MQWCCLLWESLQCFEPGWLRGLELGNTRWVCSARCPWDVVWLSAGALLKKEAVTVVEVELKLPLAFSSRVENHFSGKKEGVGGSRKSTEVFLKEDMPTVQSRKCHGDRRLVA